MGRPKAWLPWFGKTMLEHVVEQIESAVDEIVVVTSPELELPASLAGRPALQIVRDREPARGPLAGIREGLEAAPADWSFITSTDAPFVTARFVEALFAQATEQGKAVAPLAEGHLQVLSAVYPGTARAEANALLAAGRARPMALLEAVGFSPAEVFRSDDRLPPPWHGFNTPADYLACVRRIDAEASCEVEVLGRLAVGMARTSFRVPVDTLAGVLASLPLDEAAGVFDGDRLAKAHLVSLGGRDLVRDLALPIGPGERLSLFDALAGG
jgi:molybdopterin-guanine dinucleotide biosynthesis protein A